MEQAAKTKRGRFSKVQKKGILEAFNSGQVTCTELDGQSSKRMRRTARRRQVRV